MLGEIFIDDATEGMGTFQNSSLLSILIFCTPLMHTIIICVFDLQ